MEVNPFSMADNQADNVGNAGRGRGRGAPRGGARKRAAAPARTAKRGRGAVTTTDGPVFDMDAFTAMQESMLEFQRRQDANIQSLMKSQMDTSNQILALNKQVKCKAGNHKWNQKGLACQFEFCQEVMQDLSDVESALQTKQYEKIGSAIQRCTGKLNVRIDHMMHADMSPYGWAVVEEYIANPWNLPEGDEKRWRLAEKAAAL